MITVSRRDAIKGFGVLGLGAAIGMVGCSSNTSQASGASGTAVSKWDVETEVLVIGSGYTGVCAAAGALDKGAKVTLIEKNTWAGGASILSGGNARFGGGNAIQKAAGIDDTPERFYHDLFAFSNCRAVPEIMHSFADNALDTVTWLEDMGVEFDKTVSKQPGDTVACTLRAASPDDPTLSRGYFLWRPLYDSIVDRGTEVLLEHRATDLIRNDEGAVIGCIVETPEGAKNFKATKAVIIASSGYKSNKALMTQFDPRLDDDLRMAGAPYVTIEGEMTAAALAAGAAQRDMSFAAEFYDKWGTDVAVYWKEGDYDALIDGNVGASFKDYSSVMCVNAEGQRFLDENTAGKGALVDAWLNMPERPRNVWAIVDSAGAAAAKLDTAALEKADPDAPFHYSPDGTAVAATIPELAKKIGVPADKLEAEVAKYNGFAAAGVDDDFGKEAPFTALETGPFYAVKFTTFIIDQMGGIAVNAKGQVVKQSAFKGPEAVALDKQEVIPHLYAAGEAVGGLMGEKRGYGKISLYIGTARIAGEEAAGESALDAK